MPRHHILPQSYLRRFADDRRRLVMVDRDDFRQRRLVTVNNACNQVGFYELPTEDLEEHAREGHDPEVVEAILAAIEGDANRHLEALLSGDFPPSHEARFRLSMYMALQITRGWAFRRDYDALNRLLAPHYLGMMATPERVADFLRSRGGRARPKDIAAFIQRLTGPDGPKPVPRQGHYVQESLRQAMDSIMPMLWMRVWRLLEFDEPMLLTSDEPVAILKPDGQSVGPATTPAIWFPLDRQHALAMTTRGAEAVVRSGSNRARQINQIVATQAERWIFHHPDDKPLADLQPGPKAELVDETVGVRRKTDQIRVLHRIAKRDVK